MTIKNLSLRDISRGETKIEIPPKIIVANWKMNPASLKEAEKLLKEVSSSIFHDSRFELVVCPPFIYLEFLVKSREPQVTSYKLGAQNCFWENQGAYTGEISPLMLKNLGVEYAIIGHSERRNYLGETDEIIAKKIKAVLENGLKPILCVGETSEQREKGLAKEIIKEQLEKDLSLVISRKSLVRNLIIAYEPVWAIGTDNYCQPQEAAEMIKFIKSLVVSRLSFVVPVLYGGSVNSQNIADYLKYPEIDGALVGGASVKINEFKKIINEVFKSVKTEPTQK